MVKSPNEALQTASQYAAVTGITPWHPIGTYDLALQYAGVKKNVKVELVHEQVKGLEGALGIISTKEVVITGPSINSIFENHMAALLSRKYQDELKLEETPRGKSFLFQNKNAVNEVLAGVIAYKLSLPNKQYK